METEIKVDGIYLHYKGKKYQVRGTVTHSETLETMVLYDCLYENELGKTWVRPIENFLGDVVTDGKAKRRFKMIG